MLLESGAGNNMAIGDRICQLADDVGAAAVVVGNSHKNLLARALTGSISSFLVHECRHRPVVTIHAPRKSDSEEVCRAFVVRWQSWQSLSIFVYMPTYLRVSAVTTTPDPAHRVTSLRRLPA